MCLNPRTIINPSKFIPCGVRHQFLITVPCGQCVECNNLRKLEYQYRIYYEMMDTFDNGGYVMFDTLTYRDDKLPMMSQVFPQLAGDDFCCFSMRDIQLFFKRLRKMLSSDGFDIKGKLRYFVSCEYGTRSDCTHRSHYHLLLFVTAKIPPLILSRAVFDSWQNGRTDGYGTSGISSTYVLEHNVLRKHSLKLDNYVSKYVNKDSEFQSELDKRFNRCWDDLCNDHSSRRDPGGVLWASSPAGRHARITLRHKIDQFHRQSRGFGLSALRHVDLPYLFATGCLSVPDPNKVRVDVPLPIYYKRKLFYELISDVDGVNMWSPTSLGLQYLRRRYEDSKRLFAHKVYEVKINFPESEFSRTLHDDRIRDFVDYVFDWRGRVKYGDLVIEDLLSKTSRDCWYNYCGVNDRWHFGNRFISLEYLSNHLHYLPPSKDVSVFSVDDFIDRYVADDRCSSSYYGFDSLLEKFYHLFRQLGIPKQDVSDLKEHLCHVHGRMK